MSTDKTNQYIDRLKRLPPAPTVATELLVLFGDPNNNLERIVELIKHDPALTAKILRHHNSDFYGDSEPTTDMFEAVKHLGFYQVYCMVATLVSDGVMALGEGNGGFDTNRLWRHSVITAVAAGILARRVGEPEGAAFTAGLLHDIGKLILASVEGERYAELMNRVHASHTNLRWAELAEFDVDHATVGAELLVRWGLPDNIAVAVRLHNGSPSAGKPFEKLIALVQIASDLAAQMDTADFQAAPAALSHGEARSLLGLTPEDVPALIGEIQEGLKRVQGFSVVNFDAAI